MGKQLRCPWCDHDYVHFVGGTGVTLFVADDQYQATPVEVSTGEDRGTVRVTVTHRPKVPTSLRGNYVQITFACESCGQQFERVFGFHKGNTYEGTSLDDCAGDD